MWLVIGMPMCILSAVANFYTTGPGRFKKTRLNRYFAYPISLSFEPQIFKILVSTELEKVGKELEKVGEKLEKVGKNFKMLETT